MSKVKNWYKEKNEREHHFTDGQEPIDRIEYRSVQKMESVNPPAYQVFKFNVSWSNPARKSGFFYFPKQIIAKCRIYNLVKIVCVVEYVVKKHHKYTVTGVAKESTFNPSLGFSKLVH